MHIAGGASSLLAAGSSWRGTLNYIDLITFTLYITTFITPVRKLATLAEILTNGIAGLKRFAEIMRIQPTVREAENPVELKDVRGEINIDHVEFGYEGRPGCAKGCIP